MSDAPARAPRQIVRETYADIRYPITREEAVDLAADVSLPLDDGAGVLIRDLLVAVPDTALVSEATLVRALLARWMAVAGSLRPFAAASADPADQ